MLVCGIEFWEYFQNSISNNLFVVLHVHYLHFIIKYELMYHSKHLVSGLLKDNKLC